MLNNQELRNKIFLLLLHLCLKTYNHWLIAMPTQTKGKTKIKNQNNKKKCNNLGGGANENCIDVYVQLW